MGVFFYKKKVTLGVRAAITNGTIIPGVRPIVLLMPSKMPMWFGAISSKTIPNPAIWVASAKETPVMMKGRIKCVLSGPV